MNLIKQKEESINSLNQQLGSITNKMENLDIAIDEQQKILKVHEDKSSDLEAPESSFLWYTRRGT